MNAQNFSEFVGSQKADDKGSFRSLINNPDSIMQEVKVPEENSIAFELDGIPFNAHRFCSQNTQKLVLWATLGILPYTANSAEKRKNLITILEGTKALPNVLFGIDREMQIIVRSAYIITNPPPTDYIFVPLVQLMQEARPFIRLIGENL